MLIALLLFVSVVSVQFIVKNSHASDEEPLEEVLAAATPEQLKIETMMTISEIVHRQFIENIILNIEIFLFEEKQHIAISLQATEFIDESTLLKDSYNLLKEIRQLASLNEVTLKWFMPVRYINSEGLTITFDEPALAALHSISYKDIPAVAAYYNKHESLD